MPKRRFSDESGPSTQVNVRLTPRWLKEIDARAVALSRPGFRLSRADVVRHALALFLKMEES